MTYGALRVIRIVAAYAVAIATGLILLPLLFALLSIMVPAPGVWIIGAISPAFVISAPFLFPFAFLLAVVVTGFPAAAAIAISEFCSARSMYWYWLSGALTAGIAYWQLSPRTIFGLTSTAAIELAVFAIAGALAGLVFWRIAGRSAGQWRRPAL